MKKYKYTRTITYGSKRYYIRANTLEELGIKKAEKLAKLKMQQNKENNITVKEWAEKCIETYKTSQAESTRRNYKYRVNRCILSYIGDMRVKDVTPIICQQVLNHQEGKSKAQISEVSNALKFIFSHAAFNEIIDKDPTLMLKKPKGTYNPRRALTEFERKVFLEVAPSDRMYWCFVIDGQPMLHIRGTKTANADRHVPVPHELWQLIKNTPRNEYIALYKGSKISKDTRRRLWAKLWREMNLKAGTETFRSKLLDPYKIPKDLTPYCLRHEYCSELARKGVDIRIAQKLMGHSEISLTANIYTHVDTKDVISALRNK